VKQNPKKNPVKVKESLKRLFNEYYGESEDINNYGGVRYVEFNKDYATHLICYNSKVYDYFLSLKPILPIDEIWHGKIKAIVSVPFLAKQIPGYSDIVGKQKSDDIRIEQANKILLDYISK
jgi:hypothetical protein